MKRTILALAAIGCASTAPAPQPAEDTPDPTATCLNLPRVTTTSSIRKDIFLRAFRELTPRHRCCANTFLRPDERRDARIHAKITWHRGELRDVSLIRVDEPLDRNHAFLGCVSSVLRTLQVPELRPRPATPKETGAPPGEVPIPPQPSTRHDDISITYPLRFTFERV